MKKKVSLTNVIKLFQLIGNASLKDVEDKYSILKLHKTLKDIVNDFYSFRTDVFEKKLSEDETKEILLTEINTVKEVDIPKLNDSDIKALINGVNSTVFELELLEEFFKNEHN